MPTWMMSQKYAVLADWLVAAVTALASLVAIGIAVWSNGRENKRRLRERAEQRRDDSMLGVAILGGLMAEIEQGCRIMQLLARKISGESNGDLRASDEAGAAREMDRAESAANCDSIQSTGVSSRTPSASGAPEAPGTGENMLSQHASPLSQMPVSAWEGMETIPDNVLLRIIAVSKEVHAKGFPLENIRVHCNNYFTYICGTVNDRICKLPKKNGEIVVSSPEAQNLCELLCNGVEDDGGFMASTQKVFSMLADAKKLLRDSAQTDCQDLK